MMTSGEKRVWAAAYATCAMIHGFRLSTERWNAARYAYCVVLSARITVSKTVSAMTFDADVIDPLNVDNEDVLAMLREATGGPE